MDKYLLAKKEPLPLWKLAVMTAPWFGVQFAWSAEFATQTNYFQSLGLSAAYSTLTWSAGAVTGFVVQPIVGTFSDRCESEYGRRRPYLIGGMIATVVSQLLFAWSEQLGELLGDHTNSRKNAIIIGIAAVWMLGAAINVIQTPLRALVADTAAEEQQELGQSLASMWQAMGGIAGFLVAFHWKALAIMREYFGASAITIVATTVVTCCIASEKAHTNEFRTVGCCAELRAVFGSIVAGLVKMPKGMRRICVLQFCTWAAWFMFNPNWPAWMGSYIYDGTPHDPGTPMTDANNRYARGAQLGGLGQAIAAGVQFLVSFVIPRVVKVFGLRSVYVACFLVFTGAFVGIGMLPPTPHLHTNYLAVGMIALTGVPLAATNIFPFSIIGRDYGSDPNLALYMGSLNIFIVLPQLLDTTYAGTVADVFGWNWVMLGGAGWAALAVIAIFFLQFSPAEPGHRRGTYRDAMKDPEYERLRVDDVKALDAYASASDSSTGPPPMSV